MDKDANKRACISQWKTAGKTEDREILAVETAAKYASSFAIARVCQRQEPGVFSLHLEAIFTKDFISQLRN